ncbi:hypothetical protein JOB18_022676 [Solea senegalensis]|uniref:HMG box domain-containing protein n=1 Tax=Solea senegalensis TaxID=28829 RepID=A0AAV6PYE7_SOLSE|nr:hypothetical protein JOB18_022676 [Solea senegalensis]
MDFYDELIELEKAMIHGSDPLQVMIEALLKEAEEPLTVPAVECGFHEPDPVTDIVKMLQGEIIDQPPVKEKKRGHHEQDPLPTTALEQLVGDEAEQVPINNEWCDPYGPDPLQDIVKVLLGETVHPLPVPQCESQPLSSPRPSPTGPAESFVDLQSQACTTHLCSQQDLHPQAYTAHLCSQQDLQPQSCTAHLCSQQDQEQNSNVHPVMFPHIMLENLIPVTTVNGEMVYPFPLETFTPAFLPTTPLLNIPTTQRGKTSRQQHDKEQPYIKKPPNAFMLFRQEQRSNVTAELNVKNCALVNTELGKRWRRLTEQKKLKYFIEADRLRHHHEQMYPEWSTSDNYGKKRKRVRRKCLTPMTILLDPTA